MNKSEFTTPPPNLDDIVVENSEITKTDKVIIKVLSVILILIVVIIAKNLLTVPIPHNSIIVGGDRYYSIFPVSTQYAFDIEQFRKINSKIPKKFNQEVRWSPDGKWITFSKEEYGTETFISVYIARADGSQRMLIPNPDKALSKEPMWSPDGKQIVFKSFGYNNGEFGKGIYIVNIECLLRGEACVPESRLLIPFDEYHEAVSSLDWSPDGRQLVYLKERDVYIINIDGQSPPVNITLNSGSEMSSPRWSPDGTKFAGVCSVRIGVYNICVMNSDGSNLLYLTYSEREITYPRWSPDGKKIAYISIIYDEELGFNFEGRSLHFPAKVFIVNADGSGSIQLPFEKNVEIQWLTWYP